MMDPEFEKLKKEAEAVYFRTKHISCPAFDGELVYFTKVGFDHLRYKGRVPRTEEDQRERFALLPHIGDILKDPKPEIIYQYKEQNGAKLAAEFWAFIKKINGVRVKVIVRKLQNSDRKHFFSVMIQTNEKRHSR